MRSTAGDCIVAMLVELLSVQDVTWWMGSNGNVMFPVTKEGTERLWLMKRLIRLISRQRSHVAVVLRKQSWFACMASKFIASIMPYTFATRDTYSLEAMSSFQIARLTSRPYRSLGTKLVESETSTHWTQPQKPVANGNAAQESSR